MLIINKKVLKAKTIILCERLDISQFVYVYIEYLKKQGMDVADVQIINFQGMENLESFLKTLPAKSGFTDVKKVRIVTDGSVKRRVREHDLYKYKTRSFLQDFEDYEQYLFPYKSAAKNWRPGFLEDLLVETLKDEVSEMCHPISLRAITDDFLLSVNNTRGKEYKFVNHHRHVLCSLLSGTEKYVGLKLAEAAQQGAFDLDNERFNDLKEFVSRL